MSFNNKLNRLIRQASLNERVTRNSVHISLNFDSAEEISNELLQEIADTYMRKVGFGQQPYLVYWCRRKRQRRSHTQSLKQVVISNEVHDD